ncbi:hypothetical protein BOTBODRAFT_41554 [Botryobasidium botryosum FD-172 SS1]|uniref:Uncharacterized protein n=1 Tax=Botryobasidium botryosum (strain FD-172 SS1) TaxID=930990 RepID=A0A067MUJ3_BOTB1|nr:hypothetical protein BOTBODRAFT_41554 [Botryobasidium botryosum FD-172 SS1]
MYFYRQPRILPSPKFAIRLVSVRPDFGHFPTAVRNPIGAAVCVPPEFPRPAACVPTTTTGALPVLGSRGAGAQQGMVCGSPQQIYVTDGLRSTVESTCPPVRATGVGGEHTQHAQLEPLSIEFKLNIRVIFAPQKSTISQVAEMRRSPIGGAQPPRTQQHLLSNISEADSIAPCLQRSRRFLQTHTYYTHVPWSALQPNGPSLDF